MTTHDDPAGFRHDHDHADGYCTEAVRDLYLFLDGELDDHRMAAIRSHLEDCSPCFEAFDFEAELRIVISARVRQQAIPPEFQQRLLTMLDALGAGAEGSASHADADPS